jgi:hypothetical protein
MRRLDAHKYCSGDLVELGTLLETNSHDRSLVYKCGAMAHH